jgi:hypothetical protein
MSARPLQLALLALTLAACAATVPVIPAQLQPLASPADELDIQQATEIHLSTGYTRVLPAGSRWRARGTLPQGVVYQPEGTVFAIEGRQIHEAYLVVRDGALQGFYLPAESNFSPLTPPVSLPGATHP